MFDTNGPKEQAGGTIPTGNTIDFNQKHIIIYEEGSYILIKLLSF